MTDSQDAPHQPLRRSRLIALVAWSPILLLLLPLVVLLIMFLVFNYRGASQLTAARDLARRKGAALSMSDFLGKLPTVADDDNAASLYEKALILLKAEPDALPSRSNVPLLTRANRPLEPGDPRVPLPADTCSATADFVARNSEVLDLIRRARPLPKSHYPVDYSTPNVDLWRLEKIRYAARLVVLAAWVDAEEGRPHDAVENLRDALALARSLRDEPLLISSLVEMAAISITLSSGLPRAIARCDPTDADLLSLQRDLERAAEDFSLRLAVESSLAEICDLYEGLLRGRLSVNVAGQALQWYPTPAATRPKAPERVGVFLAAGYLKSDQALIVNFHLDALERVDNLTPTALNELDGKVVRIGKDHHPVACMLCRTVLQTCIQGQRTRARLASAAAAMAALRYRNDHAAWPDSLDTLVPDYMTAVPIDTFSGHPLIYSVTDAGIMAYSVGPAGAEVTDASGKSLVVPPSEELDSEDRDRLKDRGFRMWNKETPAAPAAPVEGLTK